MLYIISIHHFRLCHWNIPENRNGTKKTISELVASTRGSNIDCLELVDSWVGLLEMEAGGESCERIDKKTSLASWNKVWPSIDDHWLPLVTWWYRSPCRLGCWKFGKTRRWHSWTWCGTSNGEKWRNGSTLPADRLCRLPSVPETSRIRDRPCLLSICSFKCGFVPGYHVGNGDRFNSLGVGEQDLKLSHAAHFRAKEKNDVIPQPERLTAHTFAISDWSTPSLQILFQIKGPKWFQCSIS